MPGQENTRRNARTVEQLEPMYGEASVADALGGNASWVRGQISPNDQKGQTGWLADLYGGIQTGDDWARVNVPVFEQRVADFNRNAGDSQWTWQQTNAEVYGVNIVIWVHDPKDLDKRAEITQAPSHADLEKAAGWNAHELDPTVTQFFYYGENTTTPGGTASDLTAGTQYTWGQFQADNVFSTWTIYRITFEWGWYSTGTFESAYVAEIKLNGMPIYLRPDSGGSGRIANRFYTVTSGDFAGSLEPKTPFELLSVALKTSAVLDTGEDFTLNVDAARGAAYDVNIITEDLFVGSRTSYFATFENRHFRADDVLDFFQTNGSDDTLGMTISYRTVFG
ncbi:hypothetical protein LCGC14_2746430 [marine sediment metagenome]|uniref:Uncharacterized protein n=1 Tax=marine sediment metagenome TaxID=412755 RepID=A0A0F9BBT6_9ZZZZ